MSSLDIFEKAELKAELLRLMKNQIVIETDTDAKELRPDACKIGGKPFLPADFIWPVFTGKEDDVTRPLSFFCQLNLSEVAPFDTEYLLPAHGMLSFFYECESFCCGFDPKDKGAARVFYFEDVNGFVPFDIPEDLEQEYRIPELAIELKAEKSFPMNEEFDIHSAIEIEYGWEDYDELMEELGQNMEDCDRHKILGYADIIQGEMLSECERTTRGLYCGDPESYQNTPKEVAADIQEKAKEWILLLQLSTIEKDGFEFMFGDCGMLYYYIKKEDLAARRFENMWFSLQCF